MVWQRSGTVSVQSGSTTVVGSGADFAASSRVGDSFVGPDGATYEVANVASASVISILPAYKGPTVSGAAYAIMPVQGYDKMLSDAFNSLNNQFGPKLAALGSTGNYEILPVLKGDTGGSTAADARTALGLGTAATANVTKTAVSTVAGEITKVGDFGIGGNLVAFPATSFNDFTVPTGEYFATSSVTNPPYAGAFWGVSVARFATDGSCRQIVWDLNSSYALFFRNIDRGAVTAWLPLYNGSNVLLDPSSGGLMSSTTVSGWRVEKFANGTCIVTGSGASANYAINQFSGTSITIPSVFVGEAEVLPIVAVLPSANENYYPANAYMTGGVTTLYLLLRNGSTGAQALNLRIKLIGRWKA